MWHDGLMKSLDDLRVFFDTFFNRQETRAKEMKRVFQWRRYLEWKDLSNEEKLSAKRILFLPIFAYFITIIHFANSELDKLGRTSFIPPLNTNHDHCGSKVCKNRYSYDY